MNTIPTDTTVEAMVEQFEVLRQMTTQQRAAITFELIENLHRIVEDGVRYRHPDYDDDKVKLAAFRLRLGDKLFRQVFGDMDIKR